MNKPTDNQNKRIRCLTRHVARATPVGFGGIARERILAIENVIIRRSERGAPDDSIINWLENLKNSNSRWDRIIEGFIGAIKKARGI